MNVDSSTPTKVIRCAFCGKRTAEWVQAADPWKDYRLVRVCRDAVACSKRGRK